ncbi:DUF998 domain-containing protein [Yersinia nurmii]|uniref:DUF998 domain-containing protein n=1 Tax=Yersinia nurmii TaxID=685706 RepID=A0AAW7K3V1_9GAMM|nr:DUF998 domain-containing protein [Yersinia nurmii]MDN0089343.1 DUF998 domain-containing protein [Yersinia nurmii]
MLAQIRWQKIGAWCFTFGGLQYLLVEKISAFAWLMPVYSYRRNYISDLGIPLCGLLADNRQICSPLHWVMNIGFAVEGILFLLACWLLRPIFNGRLRHAFLLFGLLHGAGGVIIALFHSGGGSGGDILHQITFHQIGAVMAIGSGNLCLLAAGWMQRDRAGFYYFSQLSLGLGGLGLLSMLLIPLNLLPVGMIERASVYPITLWQIFTGIFLLTAGKWGARNI